MKMQGELSTVKETTKVMDMHPFGPLFCSCFIYIYFFSKRNTNSNDPKLSLFFFFFFFGSNIRFYQLKKIVWYNFIEIKFS